jgi:peptidoglycan/LPS O-acetylase OafA/YrhL
LADVGIALCGGYLIFWFAFLPNTPTLNHINTSTDLSYGVYLYAWPIQKLVITFFPNISPWLVALITAATAALIAYVSWTFIEKPSLSLKSGTWRISML